jgi:hypothetical protein
MFSQVRDMDANPLRREEPKGPFPTLRASIAVLLVLIGFGAPNVDELIEGWRAMYPDDVALRTALHICFENDAQFNRMNVQARADCYSNWLPVIQARQ